MKPDRKKIPRREFLLAAGGIAAGFALKSATAAAAESAAAISTAPAATREAIAKVVGTARVNPGKVTLDLPALVENGNAVPLSVKVDSPMTQADHVKAIHVFTEKNPLPNVVSFFLGPRAGRASVATRIRLADTQTVHAICELSDGSFWSGSVDVVVTLAACTEVL
jgi:sulfur-oxidizing protein SoxY